MPTGNKIATHHHLKDIKQSSFEKLVRMSDSMIIDYIDGNEERFFDSLNMWNIELEALGLVHEYTIELMHKLRVKKEVVFAKGCGAMGADVILIVFESKNKNQMDQILAEIGLKDSYSFDDQWAGDVAVVKC